MEYATQTPNTQPQDQSGKVQGLWTLGDIDKAKLLKVESLISNLYENWSSLDQTSIAEQLKDVIDYAYSLSYKYFKDQVDGWNAPIGTKTMTFKQLREYSPFMPKLPKEGLKLLLDVLSKIFDVNYALPMGDKLPFTRTTAKKTSFHALEP